MKRLAPTNIQIGTGRTEQPSRLYVFELLRAVACLMVVLEHVFLPAETITYLHEVWCFSFGGLGIGIFTFISGYLIARSLDHSTIGSFAWSRLFRIWPTYLTVLLIALIVFKVFGYSRLVPTEEAEFGGVAAQAFLIRDFFNMYNPLISSDWTLMYEVQFYVVIALSWIVYSKTDNIRYFIYTYFTAITLLYLLYSLLSLVYGHGEVAIQRSGGSMFCFIGTLFYFWETRRSRASAVALPAAWVLGAYFFTYFFGSFSYGYLQVSVTQLQAIILAVASLRLQRHIKPNKVMEFFADISFPLYLTHQTFGLIGITAVIGYDIGLNMYLDRAVWFGAVIIPGCYLIHILIERRMILNRKHYARKLLAGSIAIGHLLQIVAYRRARK